MRKISINTEKQTIKINNFPDDKEVSIYIHWPFCASLCPYCDFNSYISKKIDLDAWNKAYKKAVVASADQTDSKYVKSIYFGGGTPSLMKPYLVGNIINEITRVFKVLDNVEITLEANPSSSDRTNFQSYAASGVNRCSLGVQALNDQDLKNLGRLHSVKDALEGIEVSQFFFKSSNFDLIYGRQHQSVKDWEFELCEAITLKPKHLSLYQLTIEPGTPFFNLKEKNRLGGLPSDNKSCRFYETTKSICKDNGMNNYEISNYALRGMESIHNLNYWRYGNFIGIGPGAFGRIIMDGIKYETETYKNPSVWLKSIEKSSKFLYSKKKKLALRDQAREYAIMSFRLKEGLNIKRFNSFSDLKICESKIHHLVDLGLITKSQGNLIKTDKGELLLNSIVQSFMD